MIYLKSIEGNALREFCTNKINTGVTDSLFCRYSVKVNRHDDNDGVLMLCIILRNSILKLHIGRNKLFLLFCFFRRAEILVISIR